MTTDDGGGIRDAIEHATISGTPFAYVKGRS